MRIAANLDRNGIQRNELLAAVVETAGLFLIFIVAITTRNVTGDAVKLLLTLLTVVVGGFGVAGGLAIVRRALSHSESRIARIALAGWMIFSGAYSVIHVLS